MELRFHFDLDTMLPHFASHGVEVHEVEWIMRSASRQVIAGMNGVKIAMGQTEAGRYLRVVFMEDEDGEGSFIITAYEMTPKQKQAFRKWKKGKR